MKIILRAVVFISMLIPVSVLAQDCDRECLRNMMENYLEAVAANNPSSVPLMIGFRQTDNAVVKRPGMGVWESVTSLGTVQRYYLDPVSGQAAYFGTVLEGEQAIIVTVRLKVHEAEISEAEWIIARPNDPGMIGPPTADGSVRPAPFNVENFIANPPPAENIVPVSERLSRTSLQGLAESYFDTISNHDSSLAYIQPDCYRIENGVLLTGRPLPEGRTDGYEGRTNCSSGFQLGGPLNIAAVVARRYPVIDEEQQVIMGNVVFKRLPDAIQRRLALTELFYFDDALIESIHAAMFYADPTIALPNWPPFDGNFPLPPSFGRTQ